MKKDGSKSRMDEGRLEFDVDELIAKLNAHFEAKNA